MKYIKFILLIIFVSCSGKSNEINYSIQNNYTPPQQQLIKKYRAELIDTIPHNVNFYTQGFIWYDGKLYEGTGQQGESSLIKYKNNFSIDKIISLDSFYFGEGVTILNNKIYQLT
jgi:glutamine cyclotransferase